MLFKRKKGVHERKTGKLGSRKAYGKHFVPKEITINLCKDCYLSTKQSNFSKVYSSEVEKLKRKLGTDY